MSWHCTVCGATVSDMSATCTACRTAPGSTASTEPAVISYKNEKVGVVSGDSDSGCLEQRDAEGYTRAERMKRRPQREIADGHLIAVQRARRAAVRAQQRRAASPQRDPMPGAVSGTVRTSRPIFFRPIGGR